VRLKRVVLAIYLLAIPAFAGWKDKVDPRVLQDGARGETEFLVLLSEQAHVKTPPGLTKQAKGARVVQQLTTTAARTQLPLLKLLQRRKLAHQPFWIVNAVLVHGAFADIQAIAQRPEVASILANTSFQLQEPTPAPSAAAGIEWGIAKVHAPEVWSLGYTGQGVVIGGQDTGYQWDHPALINHYRGYTGPATNHNYNWHDAIHSQHPSNSVPSSCGYNSLVPCDDHSHGTHTMGTMVGDDGAGNQIGMAPGAKWIGCRNMDQNWGTPAGYLECFQWFLAPTDLSGLNTNPAMAPDVINNSWYSDASEGTTNLFVFQPAVEALRAAGIVVVVSAGNAGPSCSTITSPAIYDASFSVGATDSSDNIAGFSSRGPVTLDGSNRLKPDISAPGVGVRSSIPNNSYATFSGTSMAGPHVVGLVALLLSAHPELKGNVDMIEYIITHSAVPRTTTQTCGGLSTNAIPNNTYGWGRIDALAAIGLDDSDGDGMIDYHEFLAGTDHRNSADYLHITGIESNLISFTSVTNKLYNLQWAFELSATNWDNIVTNIPGTGVIVTVADPDNSISTQRFYRVQLLP
jgi:serine protease AprX